MFLLPWWFLGIVAHHARAAKFSIDCWADGCSGRLGQHPVGNACRGNCRGRIARACAQRALRGCRAQGRGSDIVADRVTVLAVPAGRCQDLDRTKPNRATRPGPIDAASNALSFTRHRPAERSRAAGPITIERARDCRRASTRTNRNWSATRHHPGHVHRRVRPEGARVHTRV